MNSSSSSSIDEYAAPIATSSLIMDGGSLFVSLGDLPCDDDDQIVPDLLTPVLQCSSSIILASHHHYGQGGGGAAVSGGSNNSSPQQLSSPELTGYPGQVIMKCIQNLQQ